jgi:hypothetical protein
MARSSLRAASIVCLAVWAAIWLLFLVLRFSTFDVRTVPGAGKIMLVALAVVFVAPIMAMGLAVASLVRRPRVPLSWLILGAAILALVGMACVFLYTRWL